MAWVFCALFLLTLASLSMAEPVLSNVSLEGKHYFAITFVLLLVTFVFEMALPILLEKMTEKTDGDLNYKKNRNLLNLAAGLVTMAIVGIVWILYFRDLTRGLSDVLEVFFNVYNRIHNTNLGIGRGVGAYAEFAYTTTILSAVVVIYAISKMVDVKLLNLIVPVLLVFLPMVDGRTPEWRSIVYFVLGTLVLINATDRVKNLSPTLIRVALLSVLVIFIGTIFSGAAEDFLRHSDDAKNLQSTIESKLRVTLGLNDSTTRFIDNTDLNYKGTLQMEVTLNSAKAPDYNIYFKNFVGQDYDLGAWNRAGTDFDDEFDDYFDDYSEDEVRKCMVQNLYDAVNYYDFGVLSADIKVEYKTDEATSIPYFFKTSDEMLDLLSGDVLPDPNISYGTIELPVLTHLDNIDMYDIIERGSYSVGLTVEGSAVYTLYNGFAEEKYLETIEGITPADFDDFSSADWDACHNALNQDGLIDINWGRYNMALYVKDYLASNYSYTKVFDELDYDEDSVLYFLEDSKEGCCRHFASAAVLILRENGVPARYASGYVVKPSMFEIEDGAYVADVKDYCEHAWVEVYLDYIGWIPIEVTPGYDADVAKLPTQKDFDPDEKFVPKSVEATNTPTPTPTKKAEENTPTPKITKEGDTPTPTPKEGKITNTPTPKSATTTPKPGGTNGDGGGTESTKGLKNRAVIVKVVLIVVLLAAVLVTILVLKRKSAERLFGEIRAKRYKSAARRMNRRVYRRLCMMAKLVPGATDEAYAEAVLKYTGDEEVTEAYMEAVKKAAFSNQGLTKRDLEAVYRVYAFKKTAKSKAKREK